MRNSSDRYKLFVRCASAGALALAFVGGCSDAAVVPDMDTSDLSAMGDLAMGPDASRPLVPPGFERWCAGKDPTKTNLVTVGELKGTFSGSYKQGIDASGTRGPIVAGTQEMMKIIAPAPMWVDKIRVAFASGSGMARIRLQNTFGRSYPASFPETDPDQSVDTFPHFDPNAVDIVPPIDIEVKNATQNQWIDVDVSAAGGLLLPTVNYIVMYEHLDSAPFLAIETVPAGEYSRATTLYPDQSGVYGVSIDANGTPGNFRLEVVGHAFCEWTAADKWFTDTTPLNSMSLGTSEFADVNGDGHDDLVVTIPRDGDGAQPKVYFGDGKGAWKAAPFDALALANESGMMAFGDYDNDGDQDLFATVYVYPDQDGDSYVVQTGVTWDAKQGDCNDHETSIHPGAAEQQNGRDDNCDGVADEGTAGAGDTSDADKDGYSVAKGDCDDTKAIIHPGAPELLDGYDNDCNGKADDTIHHLVLLNTTADCKDPSGNCPNGDGHYVLVKNSGLELSEPASEVAIGDTNGDGALDVYWGSWLIHYPDAPAGPSHFFEGNPDCKTDKTKCGTFTDKMKAVGMVLPSWKPVYGVTFNDFNNDGLQDIYVGNYQLNDNVLWQNMGGEMFKNVAAVHHVDHDDIPSGIPQYPGAHSYGSDFGDVNNDGYMDFFVCNLSHPRTQPWADPSQFLINQGAPGYDFVNKRWEYGIDYDEGDLNAAFGDFDNDMDLDLAIGGVYQGHYTRLYRNDGDKFTDVTYETGAQIHQSGTVGWSDVNEDGALDLKLHGSDAPALHLFINKIGLKNNWTELVLQGTTTNRDGIGARVTLKTGGVSQMRDVRGSSGGGISANQSSRVVHFGLAQNKTVDAVTVHWVGGATETITGVAPNGMYRIIEGSGKAVKVH